MPFPGRQDIFLSGIQILFFLMCLTKYGSVFSKKGRRGAGCPVFTMTAIVSLPWAFLLLSYLAYEVNLKWFLSYCFHSGVSFSKTAKHTAKPDVYLTFIPHLCHLPGGFRAGPYLSTQTRNSIRGAEFVRGLHHKIINITGFSKSLQRNTRYVRKRCAKSLKVWRIQSPLVLITMMIIDNQICCTRHSCTSPQHYQSMNIHSYLPIHLETCLRKVILL